jgi:protein gp37
MEKTLISYCDSTVNLTKYCVGCELWSERVHKCYAGRMTERWEGAGAFSKPVEMLPGRMAKAARWSDLRGTDRPGKPWLDKMPRVIFVGDMSDSLSPSVSNDFLYDELIQTVTSPLGQRHIWLWLTKQAPRLPKFDRYLENMGIDWPGNLWPGVSVTSNSTTRRMDALLKTRAKIRWVSVEPLLGFADLALEFADGGISWVVCGGESGPAAQPMQPDWARGIRDQCVKASVPFYFKQWGEHDEGMKRVGRKNTGELLDGVEWRQMPVMVKV